MFYNSILITDDTSNHLGQSLRIAFVAECTTSTRTFLCLNLRYWTIPFVRYKELELVLRSHNFTTSGTQSAQSRRVEKATNYLLAKAATFVTTLSNCGLVSSKALFGYDSGKSVLNRSVQIVLTTAQQVPL